MDKQHMHSNQRLQNNATDKTCGARFFRRNSRAAGKDKHGTHTRRVGSDTIVFTHITKDCLSIQLDFYGWKCDGISGSVQTGHTFIFSLVNHNTAGVIKSKVILTKFNNINNIYIKQFHIIIISSSSSSIILLLLLNLN